MNRLFSTTALGMKLFVTFTSFHLFLGGVFAQNDKVKQWQLGHTGPLPVSAGPFIDLMNSTIMQYITYGEREYGINLVWTEDKGYNSFSFRRSTGTGGPLKYGEPLAIYVQGGGYLRYGEREYGINLVWSTTPVYEWKITGRKPGKPVQSVVEFGLYNMTIKNHVVYCERPYGINLRWAKDCEKQEDGTAQAHFSVRVGPFPEPGTSMKCTSRVIWTLTPVKLVGSSGKGTTTQIDRNFEVSITNTGPKEWYCFFNDVAGGLRTGTWKITAQTPTWSATCEVELHEGTNLVNFTEKKQGCKQGLSYP